MHTKHDYWNQILKGTLFFHFVKFIAVVTGQHGVQLCVAMYAHNTKVCGERNRFLLTGFPIWGGWEHSFSKPISPTKHRKPATLKKIKVQIHVQLLLIYSPRLLLKQVTRASVSLVSEPHRLMVVLSLRPGVCCQFTFQGHPTWGLWAACSPGWLWIWPKTKS